MIQSYSEMRLTLLTLASVATLTAVYMVIVSIFWGVESADSGYGVLPTFAVGSLNGDTLYTTVSMYFFVFGVFAEGLLFAFLLD